ncbi:MAG: hypothetical protein P4L90_10225 [Rhodopila sp.]|nr:hypothetical protein [Rhodopila sp.]
MTIPKALVQIYGPRRVNRYAALVRAWNAASDDECRRFLDAIGAGAAWPGQDDQAGGGIHQEDCSRTREDGLMDAIHNARITLAATALINLAVGTIISGIVVPLIKGDIDSLRSAAIWTVIGLDFAWLAHVMLGRLRP